MSTSLIETPDAIAMAGSENCLPVGTRVAEFEVTGIVGEGGFGIVYLAFDHSLQRVVALKEYMPGVMAGRGADQSVLVRSKRHQEAFDTGLRSFINEARLLAQFDHPALIKIHRFWEQNNTGYMAMRYYEGQTLKRILQDHPERVDQAWLKVILQSILEALEALYRVKVLHRDISPENIMIQQDGAAVLLDFGAARQIISDMTQALTVILKPGYAPIEQYADDPSMLQGPWTDIYSLSAVMYGAIAARTPPSSVARMIQDPLPPLASGGHPGFDTQFLAAIDRGLAVKPEDRPRSIPAFRLLLGLTDAPQAGTVILPPDDSPLDPGTRPMPRQADVPLPAKAKPTRAATQAKTAGKTERSPTTPLSGVTPKRAGLAAVALLLAGAVAYFGYGQTTVPAAGALVTAPAVAPAAEREQFLDEETLAWEKLKQQPGTTAQQVGRFIALYPNGRLIGDARVRLAALQAAEAASPATPAASASPPAAAPASVPPAVTAAAPAITAAANVSPAASTPAPAVMAAPAAAGGEKPVAADGLIAVGFSVKPWGNVIVDGVDRGVSPPLRKLMLAAGRHSIKITNPGFPDHVSEVEIGKKKSPRVTVDFVPR